MLYDDLCDLCTRLTWDLRRWAALQARAGKWNQLLPYLKVQLESGQQLIIAIIATAMTMKKIWGNGFWGNNEKSARKRLKGNIVENLAEAVDGNNDDNARKWLKEILMDRGRKCSSWGRLATGGVSPLWGEASCQSGRRKCLGKNGGSKNWGKIETNFLGKNWSNSVSNAVATGRVSRLWEDDAAKVAASCSPQIISLEFNEVRLTN